MKKHYKLMVDFRGRDKFWVNSFEVDAESDDDAVSMVYLKLHKTMKCAFRVWSVVELVDNPKYDIN